MSKLVTCYDLTPADFEDEIQRIFQSIVPNLRAPAPYMATCMHACCCAQVPWLKDIMLSVSGSTSLKSPSNAYP